MGEIAHTLYAREVLDDTLPSKVYPTSELSNNETPTTVQAFKAGLSGGRCVVRLSLADTQTYNRIPVSSNRIETLFSDSRKMLPEKDIVRLSGII